MEKILLVDDEPLILKALVRLLQRTPCLCDGRLFKLELVTFSDPSKFSLIIACRVWMVSSC